MRGLNIDQQGLVQARLTDAARMAWKMYRWCQSCNLPVQPSWDDVHAECLYCLVKAASMWRADGKATFFHYFCTVIWKQFITQFLASLHTIRAAYNNKNTRYIPTVSMADPDINRRAMEISERDIREQNEAAQFISEILQTLPERSRLIVELRMHGMTWKNIGRKFGDSITVVRKEFLRVVEQVRRDHA